MNIKSLTLALFAAVSLGAAEYTFETPDKWQQPKLLTAIDGKLVVNGSHILVGKKLVKINPGDTIKIRGSYVAGANSPKETIYIGFKTYDKNRNEFRYEHSVIEKGTDTTLAKAAKAGDKVIYVTDGSKWQKAKEVAINTSPDLSDLPNRNLIGTTTKVEKEGNIWKVTINKSLKAPIAKGTNLRQHGRGGWMYYCFYSTAKELKDPRTNTLKAKWHGVAYVRFLVLANWKHSKGAKLEMVKPGFEVIPAAK